MIVTRFLFALAVLVAGLSGAPQSGDADRSDDLTVFVAGDAILNRPWSQHRDAAFLELIREVRSADVALVNLETLIHTFEGFTVTNTGGTPMHSDPAIARELVWAGFDMVGVANNHTNDYGVVGLLETIAFAEAAGLGIAGGGIDLSRATAPAYYDSRVGRVALISTTTSGQREAGASRSTQEVPGRPGLNPLRTRRTERTVKRSTADKLFALGVAEKLPGVALGAELSFFGRNYRIGDRNEVRTIRGLHPDDLNRNFEAVRRARVASDLVVVTIHAHGTQGLEEFARACIDAGADLFFGHGPHVVRGVEIYRGKPIFYSLGNLSFQSETVKRLPAYYVARRGFDDDATSADVMRTGRGMWNKQRSNWESIVATARFRGRRLVEVRLIPVNLGLVPGELDDMRVFDVLPFSVRGRPMRAGPSLGRYMIEKVARLSRKYDTEIEYRSAENLGVVVLPQEEERR